MGPMRFCQPKGRKKKVRGCWLPAKSVYFLTYGDGGHPTLLEEKQGTEGSKEISPSSENPGIASLVIGL